jgi:hypothetical protein
LLKKVCQPPMNGNERARRKSSALFSTGAHLRLSATHTFAGRDEDWYARTADFNLDPHSSAC